MLMLTCVDVEIDEWAEITLQRPLCPPLSKPVVMAMLTVMEMLLRVAVEVEVAEIIVLIEGEGVLRLMNGRC